MMEFEEYTEIFRNNWTFVGYKEAGAIEFWTLTEFIPHKPGTTALDWENKEQRWDPVRNYPGMWPLLCYDLAVKLMFMGKIES